MSQNEARESKIFLNTIFRAEIVSINGVFLLVHLILVRITSSSGMPSV